MAGFGSLAPGDWRDAEASQALALQQADEAEAASKNRSWGDTARDILKAPARIFGALASAPPSAEADQAAMMPETFANPLVTNLLGGAGAAVKSGATLPGDVAAGRVPMVGPDGHTSPEMIHRAFDTASMAGGGSVAGALSEDAAKAGAGVNVAAHAPTFDQHAPLDWIKAYHGSPHDFDQFDLSKIGTGEGVQAYGHGLYFAENPEVAHRYAENLGTPTIRGVPYDEKNPDHYATDLWHNTYEGLGKSREYATQTIGEDLADMKAAGRSGDASRIGFYQRLHDIFASGDEIPNFDPIVGHRYEVNIGAHPDHFLDWDKPASEQSQHVRDALAKVDSSISTKAPDRASIKDPEIRSIVRRALKQNEGQARDLELTIDNDSALHGDAVRHAKRNGVDLDAGDMRASDHVYGHAKDYLDALASHQSTTGEALSRILGVKGSDAMAAGTAAAKVREAGIPGIKYLDQGSRSDREGTRNYVVFDPNLVKIARKYVAPIAAGATGFGSLAQSDHE